MTVHWHRGVSQITACGVTAYPATLMGFVQIGNRFITRNDKEIHVTREQHKITCKNCQRVLGVGLYRKKMQRGYKAA